MEIRTKAYLPFKLNEAVDKVIVSEELILKDKEIIGFRPMPQNYQDWGFNNIDRQLFTVKYLDKYHTIFEKSEESVEICFKNQDKIVSVFIMADWWMKCKLKWMTGEHWLLKNDNYKWVVSLFFSLSALIISIIALVSKTNH